MQTTEAPTLEGLPLVLPPHLTANFDKADSLIKEFYGQSPGVPALVRLWVACGTSGRIQREFERAGPRHQTENHKPKRGMRIR